MGPWGNPQGDSESADGSQEAGDPAKIHRSALTFEIAKVVYELTVLRDVYLPMLARCSMLELSSEGCVPSDQFPVKETTARLALWIQAVDELNRAASRANRDAHRTPLRAEDFKEFMWQEATPAFSWVPKGIRWNISVFTSLDKVHRLDCPPSLARKDKDYATAEEVLAALPEVKRWMLSLPPECQLMNVLCQLLPVIADADPRFVKKALDLRTWRWQVMANTTASEEERREWLNGIDGHGVFRCGVNNALLHNIAALGNNHFMAIRHFLKHPCIPGGYTGLIPHYLFALLFQKVSILRQIAAGGRSLGGAIASGCHTEEKR
jgi:hypothetical protein